MKLTERQKGQKFLASIYTKAWRDKNFKQQLIIDPIETLNKFTGKTANISENKKLVVEDQTHPNHIYLNIPSKPNLENMELTEEQLELIAGGGDVQDLQDWWDSKVDEIKDWFSF